LPDSSVTLPQINKNQQPKLKMKYTTLAAIVVSAQAAAQKAFAAADALAQQSIKLEEFAATGFDRADYPTWENSFNSQVEMLAAFSTQDSPATKAAKKAAAAAAAAPAA